MTTFSAAILAEWPTAFQARFTALQDLNTGDAKIGLSKMFRRAYSHLYRGLKEPEFNRRRAGFQQPRLRHCWGYEQKRIRHLVTQGLLDGSESVSHTGRRFLIVRRDQVEALDQRDISEVNLSTAMVLLVLGKARLRELVRLLFPTAYRPASEHGYPPWRINRTEVETYLEIRCGPPQPPSA